MRFNNRFQKSNISLQLNSFKVLYELVTAQLEVEFTRGLEELRLLNGLHSQFLFLLKELNSVRAARLPWEIKIANLVHEIRCVLIHFFKVVLIAADQIFYKFVQNPKLFNGFVEILNVFKWKRYLIVVIILLQEFKK